jgi:hypothetical protein
MAYVTLFDDYFNTAGSIKVEPAIYDLLELKFLVSEV